MKIQRTKQQEARDFLLNSVKIDAKTKLIIVIKSVAASGMSRRMRVGINNIDVSYRIADLCDLKINENGLQIDGCDMDMTFWLANNITNNLYGYKSEPKNKRPKWLSGNGGECLDWITRTI